ncbi:CDP-alcohol phosphatidyltransferase family protein [Gemmatimonas groenlandica]|uniref:CDP-alcohol phosphatidyltransferase family protein n=1 Tax=Gemmatimonas groenlandica TaxID=2732249 RepID=A0A6M4IIS5_9BACT|nr:CDP-alcohol phosphatidyltransferase family protein [Gemmatimonas groenlandica]QJR34683.1 CDP-alcohol phosphatidyltransferase family protein [Gemmatimonas groenlandica]
MIDEPFRQWLARRWSAPAVALHRAGISANQVTIVAAVLGLTAAALVAVQLPLIGIALWLVSRLLDGFDGMLARLAASTSLYGGYLDITLDMLAYSAMATAFAIAMPADVVLWMVVLVGYVLAITSTLALSSLAERADRTLGGNRSIQFTRALAEGGETTAVYVVIALAPSVSRYVLVVWIVLLTITVIQRTALARRLLS